MNENQFLLGKHYEESEKIRYKKIAEMVEAEYPYLIAKKFKDYKDNIITEEYSEGFKNFVKIFDLTIRFVCFVLLHRLKQQKSEDPSIEKALQMFNNNKDGDWFEIFRVLIKIGIKDGIFLAEGFMNMLSNKSFEENVGFEAIIEYKKQKGDYDVFICYNSKDIGEVKQICGDLMKRGILPWRDKTSIGKGKLWGTEIENQICKSKKIAVFLGKNGIGENQKKEIDLINVFEHDTIMIVFLKSCTRDPEIPERLKKMQFLKFQDSNDPINELVSAIKPIDKLEDFCTVLYLLQNEYKQKRDILNNYEIIEMLAKYEPCFFDFLDGVRNLGDYLSFTVYKKLGEDRYSIDCYSGIKSERKQIYIKYPLKLDDYYLSFNKQLDEIEEKDILTLKPFVIYTKKHSYDTKCPVPYLFDSRVINSHILRYLSHNLEKRIETEEYTSLLDDFIDGFINLFKNPSFVRKDDNSFEYFLDYAQKETRNFIESMRAKYNPDLYVPIEKMKKAFNLFLRHNDRHGMVLVGKSGSGKTALICNMAEKFLEEGNIVVTYYSKIFTDSNISDKIIQTFLSHGEIFELLKNINDLAEREDKFVIFLFDAINECRPNENSKNPEFFPKNLINNINDILVSDEYKRIKVVMTCRDYTWEEDINKKYSDANCHISRDLYFKEKDIPDSSIKSDIEIYIEDFTDEEFDIVYSKYKQYYKLSTELTTLKLHKNRFRLKQLHNPFFLNILAECYEGKEIPLYIDIDSVKLLEDYNDRFIKGQENYAQYSQMESILINFAELLRNEKVYGGLPLNKLNEKKYESFKKQIYQNDEKYSKAFEKLLEKKILTIDEGSRYYEIRFVYERFHEFILAKIMLDELERRGKETNIVEFFEYEIENVNYYDVHWGAIRNALIMNYRESGNNPATIFKLAGSYLPRAQMVVIEILNTLSKENYKDAYNILFKLIETNQKQFNNIKSGKIDNDKKIQHIIKAQNTAIRVLYDICRSSFFMENPYEKDSSPLNLLWLLLSDPVDIIRDNTIRYIYYLWTESENSAIVLDMIHQMKDSYLKAGFTKRYTKKYLRKIEPCAILSVLIVIESFVTNDQNKKSLDEIRDLWISILKKITDNGKLKKIIVKIISHLIFKGTSLTYEYVNNIIEYQHFWNKDSIHKTGPHYFMESFSNLVIFLEPDQSGFDYYKELIIDGAALGDSFNNFLIERVLIAQGVKGYKYIEDIVDKIFYNPKNRCPEYTQMSMLYVIFHTLDKMKEIPIEPFNKFEKYMIEWTDKNYGYFMANCNGAANGGRPYKQYTLNWYGVLHIKIYGKNKNIELFQKYIKKGFNTGDTKKFLYAVDNIAMLASDFGYWENALKLFEYTLSLFNAKEDFNRFKNIKSDESTKIFDIRTYLAKTFATIKGYFGSKAENFIMDNLSKFSFPDIEGFKKDLIIFEAHEKIGDLLTHKFGNFLVYGIVNIDIIRKQTQLILADAPKSKSVKGWLESLVNRLLKEVFGI